jgi:hypothetical protein
LKVLYNFYLEKMQIRGYWTRSLTLASPSSPPEHSFPPSGDIAVAHPNMMPSITTTILTTAVTLTSFVTVTGAAGEPPAAGGPDIIAAIEKLPQCTVTHQPPHPDSKH